MTAKIFRTKTNFRQEKSNVGGEKTGKVFGFIIQRKLWFCEFEKKYREENMATVDRTL